MSPFAPHAERIARALLGDPNDSLSTKAELRWGSAGSLAVRIASPKRGTWYSHEESVGGGMLDLIERETGRKGAAAFEWLREQGIDIPKPESTGKSNGAGNRRVVAAYVYQNRRGEPVYRVLRWEPKSFSQQRWDAEVGEWVGGEGAMRDVQRVPYRLPMLLEADGPVLVVEGEKDCDRLAEIGITATTAPEGAGKWPTGFGPLYFADADVVIVPDADPAGWDHARAIADSILPVAARVRILELGVPAKGDASAWLDAGGTADQLRELIEAAPPAAEVIATWAPERETAAETAGTAGESDREPVGDNVIRLAAMRPVDYDRVRKQEAKRLGVRASTLDTEVEKQRAAAAAESGDGEGKGKALDLYEPEPWHEPVVGVDLLAELVAQIKRFVILSDQAAVGAALWIVHAHAHDAAFHSPRLTLTSPTMRCGKSTMLRTVARLIPRPLATANITPAALFRVVEAAKPSLLIDEADSFAHDNEELRGIVNSSHCRLDAFVVRTVAVADDYAARRFSTWAPMAIASIGKVASTVADRSIMIPMERKAPGQRVERMRVDQDQGFVMLGRKIARWVQDNDHKLRAADPDVLPALNDRQTDNWQPLLAIADVAGGDWPQRAREAALGLSAVDEDAETFGVQLLGDIKEVFARVEAIWTEDLLKRLHALQERPWCEYGRQRKPISARQLAGLLKPFGIAATQVWKPEPRANKNGFKAQQFESAWSRYLPSKALEPTESVAHRDFRYSRGGRTLEDANVPEATVTAGSRGLEDGSPVRDSREEIEL
jgi:Protein of unknown function (DUF3631)